LISYHPLKLGILILGLFERKLYAILHDVIENCGGRPEIEIKNPVQ